MNKSLLAATAAVAAGAAVLAAATPSPSVPAALRSAIGQSNREQRAYALLQHLTDRIGPRLSGSENAAAAIRWAQGELQAAGVAVRLEPVRVPVWKRGAERGAIVAPAHHALVLTTLGGSVATPAGGLEAEVVEADALEAIAALPDERVQGRIVLLNKPWAEPTSSDEAVALYRALSPLRGGCASAAAKKGAVACLVRSAASGRTRLAHTGALRYAEDAPKIPAAAVAIEDAELLHRLLAQGPVRVQLELLPQDLGEADSSNVVGEIRGREKPEEVVLIGGHLDSWDVGTGAIDDGAGVVLVMEALRLLQALPEKPRRTVRGVLFMNEENGTQGGKAYAAQFADVGAHFAAVESDGGGARPLSLNAVVGPGGIEKLNTLLPLLTSTGVTKIEPADSGGADTSALRARGVPAIGLRQEATHYFDWHHTSADTLDKIDPADLARNVELMTVLAWALANEIDTLPRPAPSPSVSPAAGRAVSAR